MGFCGSTRKGRYSRIGRVARTIQARRAAGGEVQARYKTELSAEDYVSSKAWWHANPPSCPFHPAGGCTPLQDATPSGAVAGVATKWWQGCSRGQQLRRGWHHGGVEGLEKSRRHPLQLFIIPSLRFFLRSLEVGVRTGPGWLWLCQIWPGTVAGNGRILPSYRYYYPPAALPDGIETHGEWPGYCHRPLVALGQAPPAVCARPARTERARGPECRRGWETFHEWTEDLKGLRAGRELNALQQLAFHRGEDGSPPWRCRNSRPPIAADPSSARCVAAAQLPGEHQRRVLATAVGMQYHALRGPRRDRHLQRRRTRSGVCRARMARQRPFRLNTSSTVARYTNRLCSGHHVMCSYPLEGLYLATVPVFSRTRSGPRSLAGPCGSCNALPRWRHPLQAQHASAAHPTAGTVHALVPAVPIPAAPRPRSAGLPHPSVQRWNCSAAADSATAPATRSVSWKTPSKRRHAGDRLYRPGRQAARIRSTVTRANWLTCRRCADFPIPSSAAGSPAAAGSVPRAARGRPQLPTALVGSACFVAAGIEAAEQPPPADCDPGRLAPW